MKIYHNPRCSKSRQALKILEEKASGKFKVIRYLETPPNRQELNEIIEMLGIQPKDLVRKTEAVYREKFKDKEMSDEDWIDAMVRYPKLIQRPIVVKDNRAIIGRPPDNVVSLL